ncbi:MAG: serine phosphatase RsbU (regulator of sigma subunit) [Phycisphaerales bacterium]|jgi:serine phosphatase RsbU (regulator of sigma subunit)
MSATGIDTTEFKQVFHVETDRLFRRRLYWFTVILLSLGAFLVSLFFVIGFAARRASEPEAGELDKRATFVEGMYKAWFDTPTPEAWQAWAVFGLLVLWFTAYGTALAFSLRKQLATRLVVNITMALIVFEGFSAIGLRLSGTGGAGLWQFVLVHFIACCVFPWKLKQALIPILIVLPASLLSKVALEGSGPGEVFVSVITAVAVTPGVLVSWWKHSQRVQVTSNKFLSQRYGVLRQELAYARQIHEAMFPEPKADGPVRFTYRYEPMRQIGGDYLHAHAVQTDDGHEELSLVILDVTGHGIPAALTVNRLYGEIDLRFADDPNLPPGDLLGHLNRYVHLTLARHSIYATALCLRVNTKTGTVAYASGGHPPAFLRASDGTLHELASTTFVLGACGEEDFDPQTTTVDFKPGDTIVAYTDGATEARAPSGQMLRIDGLRRTLVPGPVNPDPGAWPDHLLRMVANHRGGMAPEDDTLLVEIYRPLDGKG